jgi:hypothetical protein
VLELARQKFPQPPVTERPAGKPVSCERAALAREHVVHCLDQRLERHLISIVVAADEIVFGETVPFDRRRR